MNRYLSFASLFLGLLAVGCDIPDASVENEELRKKIEDLKEVGRPDLGERDRALRAELAAAREQLQIALVALEQEEQEKVAEEPPAELDGEFVDVDVDGAPRALEVEEDQDPALEVALEFGVLDPLGDAPVAALLDANDHQVFFAELSKFGDWFETTEFGFVWQPAVLKRDPTWRPYTLGRWVQSDQGWTWLSDEPFGWAVYHYGRWALLEQYGWVWIPGDDWAPAWVAWRQNDDYLGWAPLPPETLYDDDFSYDPGIDVAYGIAPDYYSFVPIEYFPEPVYPYCVPRASVFAIVIGSTNVTRYSTRNHRVHCGGPDVAWVNRRCGKQIPRCHLDFDGGRERFATRQRPGLRGDRFEVFAPRVDAPWNPAVCPSRVSGHLGRVSVVRGKGALEPGARRRFQEAAVQRQVAARTALQTDDARRAMRHNLERRQLASRGQLPDRAPRARQAVAETALRNAVNMAESTQRRLEEPNINPKQRAYAELAAKNAEEALRRAREAHAETLRAQGRDERQDQGGAVARQDRGESAPARADQNESTGTSTNTNTNTNTTERLPRSATPRQVQNAEPQNAPPARPNRNNLAPNAGKDAELAARAAQRSRAEDATAAQAPEIERQDDLAAARARQQAAEEERARVASQEEKERAGEQRAREEALAANRTRAEDGQRRTQARDLNTRQRRDAELASRNSERERQAAEQAAEQEREQQATRARVAQEQRRASGKETQQAEQNRREMLARKQAAEEAQQAQQRALAQEQAQAREESIQRQRAESDRQRRAAEEAQAEGEAQRRAEVAQQQAEAAEQRRLAAQQSQRQEQENARRQAAEAQRQALAQKQAEDAQRAALARQQQAAEERRRAAIEAQRAAQEQARADSVRQAREAQRQAEQAAQQRAAEQAARRQQEAQQRAAAEQAARARQEAQQRQAAEAQARAEAARQQQRQQAEQQRQQAEQQRQQRQQAEQQQRQRQREAEQQQRQQRREQPQRGRR